MLKIMKVRKEWIGSKKPATQENLAELQEDLHSDLVGNGDRLRQDMTSMEERLRNDLMSKETGEEILNIVKSLDKQRNEWSDIPERMTKVEDEVFKLKLRR